MKNKKALAVLIGLVIAALSAWQLELQKPDAAPVAPVAPVIGADTGADAAR